MNKIELRELLHQEYKSENWKKITEFVFPNVSYLQKPQDIPIKNYDGIVESFKQLGNVKLNDGKNLAMFEVRVSESVNIPYNRVKLRSLVAPFIDQEHNHGVLVIYEQGKENYRFTFTAKSTEFDEEKGDFVNRETDSKRYTYVLGKNESCRTAADRFFDLAGHKNEANINAVQEAFSVEKLSKQFFKEYKDHYEKFVAYLMASASYHTAIFKADNKAIRDFVKILLGRLVFIQFVQKKRWMGVPPKADGWHNGEADFLFRSFKNFQQKGLFYSHFLEPLFYETLSKPNRPNDIFTVTDTKVPYLNGGLFEKEETDTSLVNFPEAYFYDLLEFFDKYNFTINEYDPIDHEVGIDPEMLGSIFENLLEDNKDKGAFYTPKEIVHYMCQESLKEYLKTYLKDKNVWIESNDFEKALEAFVKKKEAGRVIDFDEILAIALLEVKICDPAIGSGAFPMGLLNEIYHCVYVLYSASPDVVGEVWEMDKWAPEVVKKNIIQNSIYGVDIEKGAVDIARLRFWLSLIIDEPEPHALPNLDYKIVVGDSLISKLGADIIDIDWDLKEGTQTEMFGNFSVLTRKTLLEKISSEQKDYFNPKSDKKKLAKSIRELKIELLITQFELMIKSSNQETEPKVSNYKDKKKFVLATELYLKTLGWKNSVTKLKKLKDQPEKPLHFFEWKLDFPEVMNEQIADLSGFDIVIGNPPYVPMSKEEFLRDYKSFCLQEGKIDLYRLFIEKALKIIKNRGVFSFIIPNTILTIPSCKLIRGYFLDHHSIKAIINFDSNVFDNASVNSIIFTSVNDTINDSRVIIHPNAKTSDLKNTVFQQVPQSNFLNNLKFEFNIFLGKQDEKIIQKINNESLTLQKCNYEVSLGAQQYHNTIHTQEQIKERFLHSKIPQNKNYRLELGGKRISPYKIELEGEFVDFSKEFYTKPLDKFFGGPKIILLLINPAIVSYMMRLKC